MSPVPRRWPAAAFLICCSLLAATDRASALPGAQPEAALGVIHDDATFFDKRWQDPHPGSKAYVGFHERGVLDLARRDCLPNGTNFCFGDSVNFCSNCGTCCTDGLYCCGSGGICCGGGCCASGQTCDQGRCLAADGPITVTSTAFQTVTHIATQTATVLVVVVDTSTIVQTTETTISNAETQTNTVWITTTTTALAKRTLSTLEPVAVKRGQDILVEPRLSWTEALRAAWTSVSARRLPHAIHDVLERRQATREPSAAVAPSTVTVFATQTVDFTSVVSTTITQQTTSFVMTTVIMTNTIVLNARTTIDITSTMTITSHQPVTQIITTTQSPVIITGTITAPPTRPPTTGATSTPTIIVPPPAASSTSIQTSAIVGIAVGGTVAAIIVASIIIFFIRYRRKHASSPNPNNDLPPDVNQLDREPTFPVLTHFAPAAPAAHHASGDFTPPAGQYLVPNTSTKTTPSPGGSHHRSSSNYSTLVSTPFPDSGTGAVNKNYRVSAMTAASATGSGTGEVVHEMDTSFFRESGEPSSSSENPSPGTRSPPPPVPPPRNPYRGFTTQPAAQTEPGELDGNEKYEIGPSRREDSDEDGGLLRVPGVRGQRSWSEEQRYDGDGYGTPESRRSPAVPPTNWGQAL